MSSWDNSHEYSSLFSPEIEADLKEVEAGILKIESLAPELAPWVPRAATLGVEEASSALDVAARIASIEDRARLLFGDIWTYCLCELSVNSDSSEAKKLQARLTAWSPRFSQAVDPLNLFLDYASEELVDAFLARPGVPALRSYLKHRRKMRNRLLPLEQETMISALETSGHHAWAELYTAVAGTLTCELDLPRGRTSVGIAKASGMIRSADAGERKAAWHGINKAWEGQQETCVSILNALAGWRHEVDRKRSHTEKVHFLDQSIHQARIRPETLDAMLSAAEESFEGSRRALKAQARALGSERLHPWDLFAPAPSDGRDASARQGIPYEEGIEIVSAAFARIHPEMGEFVKMMDRNKWIEAGTGGKRRTGAYCAKFAKSRSPRVFMTYMGSLSCLKTLAHELGHAYHNWVMRDLPILETHYPMTLAETASIFSESLVRDDLAKLAKSASERLAIAWNEVSGATSLTLNISARFDFEKKFYEKRAERALTHQECSELMAGSWNKYYGDSLSEPDPMFWASKLHFYMSGRSFYNYPYLFGYLFSLGIYARRESLGAGFHSAYVSLLRDTGRMDCEEIAMKHLDADLTRPDFWRKSLAIMNAKLGEFESLVT